MANLYKSTAFAVVALLLAHLAVALAVKQATPTPPAGVCPGCVASCTTRTFNSSARCYLNMDQTECKQRHAIHRSVWYALNTVPYLHVHARFNSSVTQEDTVAGWRPREASAQPHAATWESLVFKQHVSNSVWQVKGLSLPQLAVLPEQTASKMLADALGWTAGAGTMDNVLVFVHGFNNDVTDAHDSLVAGIMTGLFNKQSKKGRSMHMGACANMCPTANPAWKATTTLPTLHGVVYDWASTFNASGWRDYAKAAYEGMSWWDTAASAFNVHDALSMLPGRSRLAFNYAHDTDAATAASRPLSWLLCLLAASGATERVHVMAHSLGNRVAVEALNHLVTTFEAACFTNGKATCPPAQLELWKRRMARIRTIMLVQADMNMIQTHKAIDNIELAASRTRCNTEWMPIIFSHPHDTVLWGSSSLHGNVPRLGVMTPDTIMGALNMADFAGMDAATRESYLKGRAMLASYALGRPVNSSGWPGWLKQFQDHIRLDARTAWLLDRRGEWLTAIKQLKSADWRYVLAMRAGCSDSEPTQLPGHLELDTQPAQPANQDIVQQESEAWHQVLTSWAAKQRKDHEEKWRRANPKPAAVDAQSQEDQELEEVRNNHAGVLVAADRFLNLPTGFFPKVGSALSTLVGKAENYHSYFDSPAFQATVHELLAHYEQYTLSKDQPKPSSLLHVHARLAVLFAYFGQTGPWPQAAEDLTRLPHGEAFERQLAPDITAWCKQAAKAYGKAIQDDRAAWGAAGAAAAAVARDGRVSEE